MFYVGSSDYYFAVPKSRPDLRDDINAAMSAIARVNPRYIDEVKSNYSAQNSGSSSLNGPERSWLKANDNTITLGYHYGQTPLLQRKTKAAKWKVRSHRLRRRCTINLALRSKPSPSRITSKMMS